MISDESIENHYDALNLINGTSEIKRNLEMNFAFVKRRFASFTVK